MKQIKWLLGVLLGIVWSSSWWAAVLFREEIHGTFFLASVFTAIIVIAAIIYCIANWNED